MMEFGEYLPSECVLSLDDEEVSLVIEAAIPEGGNAVNDNNAADAPDDDTLSVGPEMPDLPLDVPPYSEAFMPPAFIVHASTPEVLQAAEKEEPELTPEVDGGTLEEENTVREEPLSTEPQVEQEEGALAEHLDENRGAGGEEGEREERQQVEDEREQRTESAAQAEEVTVEEGNTCVEETQPKPDSDNALATTSNGDAIVEAPAEVNTTSQEASVEPAEEEVTDRGERNCSPCTCQSLFLNYNSHNSHAPSRRKNRPCSLPVSELETVIASACGEPETPRSHYIRIHHLLHSLPSAQHRAPSQEEEEETREGENTVVTQDTDSTSPTLKTSKEEEGQDDDEEDTTHSPSQVLTIMELQRWIK